MILSELRIAIKERRRASIVYKGMVRIIDPYLVGINKKGHEALRAFQVAGSSTSGKLPAWRMFLVDDIDGVEVLEEKFEINYEYNPNDKDMNNIMFRV